MKSIGYIGRFFLLAFILNNSLFDAQAQQQLGSYLQYQQHPEQINQAYTFASDQAKFYTLGRRQWTGIDGAPTTILLGGHAKTKNERSVFGANLLYDKVGPERYTEANAFYGYDLKLSENDHLAATVGLGVRWYNVRYARLEQPDQALRNDIDEKVGSLNLSFMYYRPEQLYIGATLPRLGAGDFKQVQVFRENYSAVAGYLFAVDEGFHIKTNAWLAWMENRDVLGNFSAMAFFNRKFGIGLNYGTSKDLGFIASFLIDNKLKVGYGYQAGLSNTSMGGTANGTHEISISYHISRLLKPNLL
ncbi:PorP/SprF family type IX secretion system membrane protein [Sphingobacterium sp. LRF_L2]|uniref:PorP/SprF family type IX secretion system membrane protein n=1 Tax=Sphingobacterium sp. LRF_L2 TaxID=3369421 RepID=UPI003F618806